MLDFVKGYTQVEVVKNNIKKNKHGFPWKANTLQQPLFKLLLHKTAVFFLYLVRNSTYY